MKYLFNITILLVICNTGGALYMYAANNCGQQQQFLQENQLQEDLLEQQIQRLQQQLKQLKKLRQQSKDETATSLNFISGKNILEDFEYLPTVQGYRFSYTLPDGSKREENAFVTGLRMDEYSRLDSKTTDFTAVGQGGRPKMMLKNRKLSPGSLKSLAG